MNRAPPGGQRRRRFDGGPTREARRERDAGDGGDDAGDGDR